MYKKKYLFYLAKAYSISIVSPLVDLLDKKQIDYRFYISDRVRNQFPEKWDRTKILKSVKETKKFKPDFVLAPGNFVDFRIPGVKVQIFHGLGVEKPVHYKIRHFFDIFLTSGPYVTDKFKQLKDRYKYFDIIETGWLKVDYILNYQTQNIFDKYDIPKNKKIVLYAPTFSSKMESATDLIPIIPDVIKNNEYWILKFHELMPEIDLSILNTMDKNSFRIITNQDITPYMHMSDILISDTSSVVYEFLALDKPVITYKAIANEEKAQNIVNKNELRQVLDKCLEYPKYLKERRNKALESVNPYLSGNIAENILESLEKINPGSYPKKNKPLNLIRKYKIIYHSIFRKGYLR